MPIEPLAPIGRARLMWLGDGAIARSGLNYPEKCLAFPEAHIALVRLSTRRRILAAGGSAVVIDGVSYSLDR